MKLINHVLDIRRLIQQAFDNRFSRMGLRKEAATTVEQIPVEHQEKRRKLDELITLRKISTALTRRIRRNYRTIVGFNTGLIVLGVAGVIQPTTSALMHNTSTLAIGLHSMKDLVL